MLQIQVIEVFYIILVTLCKPPNELLESAIGATN